METSNYGVDCLSLLSVGTREVEDVIGQVGAHGGQQ